MRHNFTLKPSLVLTFLLHLSPLIVPALLMGTLSSPATGQNYDETKVPAYTLPDPLMSNNGERITSSEKWFLHRREEILELFRREVYGRSPSDKIFTKLTVTEEGSPALNGKAIRRQASIQLGTDPQGPKINLLIYRPSNQKKAVPAFLGLNFHGNQTIHADSEIHLCQNWMIGGEEEGVLNHRATESSRGKKASRWPVDKIISHGYAVVTAHCGDLDPDFDDGAKNGVHGLFNSQDQRTHQDDAWGTIGAWSWGLSRVMDHIEQDPSIDQDRVVLIGHSRLGKTALWAGAQDTRFSVVISNNSGCGGAALSRRQFGETVSAINHNFPHWFCDNFKKYNGRETDLPVDQHMLLSLIAPRPVYIASASEDLWADPEGEFLAALGADPVYQLLGLPGVGAISIPPPDKPIAGIIGYHLRSGPHDITAYDWEQYLRFADKHFDAQSQQAGKK